MVPRGTQTECGIPGFMWRSPRTRPDGNRTQGRVLRLPTDLVLYLCTEVDCSVFDDPGCVKDFVDFGEI